MRKLRRAAAAALACGMLALGSQSVYAGGGRSIRVDVGDSNFPTNGEKWFGNHEVDLASGEEAAVSMPFALNFSGAAGSGQIYTMDFAGYAWGAFLGVRPSQLGPDEAGLILPYYFTFPTPGSFNWSSGEWATGQVDREAPYALGQALDVIRFTWRGTISDGTPIYTQVVFFDQGSGDFDVEFNYGLFEFNYPPGGSQLLDLGAGQPLFSNYKIGFVGACFRNGVGDICAPVPEPGTISLLALGIAMLCVPLLRRRVSLYDGGSAAT